VKIALDHLEMRDADPSQYQLWAKTPREEPPYPLFGHEKPYSVKLSCLRDGLSTEEGFDLDHCNNVHDPLARCHFILRYESKIIKILFSELVTLTNCENFHDSMSRKTFNMEHIIILWSKT